MHLDCGWLLKVFIGVKILLWKKIVFECSKLVLGLFPMGWWILSLRKDAVLEI